MPISNFQKPGIRTILGLLSTSPFIRHNAVFFVGSLGVSVLNYLYYPVLGRLMAPADFGEVQTLSSLFMAAAVFLSILAYITIHITVNTESETKRRQVVLALEYIALITGGLVLLTALVLVGVMRSFLHFSSSWPFVVLLASLAVTIPLTMRMAYLRGRKRYLTSSLVDGIGSAGKLVLSPLFVVVGLKSFGAMIGLFLSQILSLGLGTMWAHQAGLRGFGLRRGNLDLSVLRPQLRYGAAVLLVSASVTALMTLDMLAIKHYFLPDQAGQYAGMATVARVVFYLAAPFTAVMLTMVSLRAPEGKNALWLKGSLALTFTIGGAAAAVMTLFSKLTIQLLVGSKYLTYGAILPRLSLAMLFLAVANMLLIYQTALRRYRYVLIPPAVTFFTLILMSLRHNAVVQIVDNIVIGSAALLLMIMVATYRSHI